MFNSSLFKQLKSIKSIKNDHLFDLKINSDSRTFKEGEVFVGLVGENFDGFDYVKSIIEKNPKAIVYHSKPGREEEVFEYTEKFPQLVFIEVTDTLLFMQELASVYIQEWKARNPERKIIGITGSNGKTTHKEMVYFLLNSLYPGKVLATKGNLNNHIGVPKTIFDLKDEHDIAIIEMGMNHAGEIQVLCDIAHPEHGMITNIGAAHIEFLKSMENIAAEKGALYKNVLQNSKGKGIFVVNGDDIYLAKLEKSEGLTTYGEKNGDIKITIEGQRVSMNYHGKTMLITNENITEFHNLKNLAGTALFAMKLFPGNEDAVIKAANTYQQPSMNRSQWISNIFLDAYNANPSSMRVSLESFVSHMKTKNISLDDCYFVLGDMNELGDFARDMHKEIAAHVKSLGIKNVTFIGRYKDFYLEGYSNPTSSYLTKEEFHNEWSNIRKKYKFMFVKASRSLKLESLMDVV
jgi:UDP-N-acetylmuramoyl-tripeptide--D-alanyl-D-alanine ligase